MIAAYPVCLNNQAGISSEAGDLNIGLRLHLHPYFVYTSWEGLPICADSSGSSEPSFLAFVKSTKISCAGRKVFSKYNDYVKKYKPLSFLPEDAVCFFRLLQIHMCTSKTRFFMEASNMNTRPHSAVGNVSDCRYVSYCRSRGREFQPRPVPYFHGD